MAEFDAKKNRITYNDINKTYQTTFLTDINNKKTTSLPKDYSTPLSFNEWLREQDGVEPNSQYDYYLSYISQWYKNKFTPVQAKQIVKTNYVALLKQLNIVFKDQINEKWFSDLDFSNDLDVQDMIEFYAVKLKEIAYFLAEKREQIKSAKLKYNLVGSNFGAIKIFSDYILNAFTRRPFAYNVPTNNIIKTLPALSSINDSFQLTIQELYDESEYFNRDPKQTTYFNSTSEQAINLLTNLQLASSDASWVYNLGSFDTVIEPPSSSTISLSDYGSVSENVLINDLLIRLTEKYIGDTIYQTATSSSAENQIEFTYNFVQGNNWFYWPSGEYIFEAENTLRVHDLPLSETTLLSTFNDVTGVTAGTTYQESDRIFVIDNTGVQGAWAQSITSTSTQATMSALIPGNSNLLFKFPYPGYGEGSDTLPWTGKSLENVTSLYRFLDKKSRKAIESFYFSDTSTDVLPINPIRINDSTLVAAGAKPAKKYQDADKIVFRSTNNSDRIHDATPDGIFTEQFDYAWLYDITRTNLGVDQGSIGKFIWPLISYDNVPDSFFTPDQDFCNAIPLSSLSHNEFIGARAGHGLYDSDIFYVLDTPAGTPTQAAFLSGQPLKHVLATLNADNTRFSTELSGVHQPGLFLKCFPGQYTTFLWADSTVNINDTTITYHEIPIDTTYYKTKHNSIFKSRIKDLQTIYDESNIESLAPFQDFGIGPGVGDWKTDESRSVLFSPIGHPGDKYTDYDKMCDIIFVDHSFPEPFSLVTWKDANGNPWFNSPDFAWFKLDSADNFNGNQPDAGWGPGKWVNANGTTQFHLSAGYQYKYLRASLRRSAAEIQLNAVPYLTIKQPYTTANTKWVKAVYLGSGFTEDPTGSSTDIVIEPGSPIAYDHYKSTSYCLTSTDDREQILTTTYNKVCSTDYKAWIDYNVLESNQVFVASWPSVNFYEDPTSGPAPSVIGTGLTQVVWEMSNDAGLPASGPAALSPTTLFVSQVTAGSSPVVYTLTATGQILTGAQVVIYSEAQELQITAIPITPRYTQIGFLTYETIENLTLPVDICVSLSGWDIDNGQVSITSPHAKPIWVIASDQENELTKNKAVSIGSVSYGFDHEILLRHQPELSPISFDAITTIDYQRKSSKPITWIQPLTYNDQKDSYKWKKLEVTTGASPLKDFTCEQFETIVVNATTEDSDIILTSPDQNGVKTQYINYFAKQPFTWNQPLRIKTIAQETTITTSLCELLTPEFEPLNILNKNYPSVAAIPDVNNIVSQDQIGIFTPENVGLPVYLGKSYSPPISANARPEFNARWMKTPATFIAKSGTIYKSKPYEKFIPYQNKYDTTSRNSAGVNYVTDITDPWTGAQDTSWRPTNPSTKDFRGAKSIPQWLSTFVTPPCTEIYNWGTDTYGNNYALLKPISITGPYHQGLAFGELWTRSIDNELSKASLSLKTILQDFQADNDIYQDVINSRIQKVAIIFDVLLICTPNGIAISTIEYDYNTKQYATKRNQYVTYNFSALHNSNSADNTRCLLGNILQSSLTRKILLPIAVPTDITDQSSFRLLEYDIENNTITERIALDAINSNKNQELYDYESSHNLNETTAPVLTFNPSTGIYNASYFSRKQTNFDGDHLISINFEFIQNSYVIASIDKLS